MTVETTLNEFMRYAHRVYGDYGIKLSILMVVVDAVWKNCANLWSLSEVYKKVKKSLGEAIIQLPALVNTCISSKVLIVVELP